MITSETLNTTATSVVRCGHCEAINHVQFSMNDDPTGLDVDGLTCWSCKKNSIFSETAEVYEGMPELEEDNLESFNYEQGTEPPKEV